MCIGVPGIILSLVGKYFPTIVLAYIIGMIFNGTTVYLNTYIIECKRAIFHGHKLIIGRVSAASEATLSSDLPYMSVLLYMPNNPVVRALTHHTEGPGFDSR